MPVLEAGLNKSDTDGKRSLRGCPSEPWDPRRYFENRLFWSYSSGLPGQWMCHQRDTVQWFSGYRYPRSVVANGGLSIWKDGRENLDTMRAVFDFGPPDVRRKESRVISSSRMHSSAGGLMEVYYSNGGKPCRY